MGKRKIALITGVLVLLFVGIGVFNSIGNGSGVDTNSAAYKEAQQRVEAKRAEAQKAAEAENATWLQTPAGKICTEHPGWSQSICNKISQQKISLGMTKEQVLLAIGEPDNVNTTATMYGTTEQWVYGYDYVYFDDGVLTSVQQRD